MEEAYLPIREFSKLTGISREALRFYDKIGLLSPQTRRKNGYRYYATRQLDFAVLISELRALGMGLGGDQALCRRAHAGEDACPVSGTARPHRGGDRPPTRDSKPDDSAQRGGRRTPSFIRTARFSWRRQEQEPIFLCPSPPARPSRRWTPPSGPSNLPRITESVSVILMGSHAGRRI